MSHRLIVRPLAEGDLADAAGWYENEQSGLAARFLDEVNRTFSTIGDRPLQFPIVRREVRRALLHAFPYAVYFRVSDDVVTVWRYCTNAGIRRCGESGNDSFETSRTSKGL